VKQAHAYEVGSAPVPSEHRDADHAVAIYLGMVGVITLTVGTAIWLSPAWMTHG